MENKQEKIPKSDYNEIKFFYKNILPANSKLYPNKHSSNLILSSQRLKLKQMYIPNLLNLKDKNKNKLRGETIMNLYKNNKNKNSNNLHNDEINQLEPIIINDKSSKQEDNKVINIEGSTNLKEAPKFNQYYDNLKQLKEKKFKSILSESYTNLRGKCNLSKLTLLSNQFFKFDTKEMIKKNNHFIVTPDKSLVSFGKNNEGTLYKTLDSFHIPSVSSLEVEYF